MGSHRTTPKCLGVSRPPLKRPERQRGWSSHRQVCFEATLNLGSGLATTPQVLGLVRPICILVVWALLVLRYKEDQFHWERKKDWILTLTENTSDVSTICSTYDNALNYFNKFAHPFFCWQWCEFSWCDT
jgi:hypothetical protein